MGSITLAFLLCVMVVYCWKRNRRLEYTNTWNWFVTSRFSSW